MVRSIWLALCFLISLCALAALKAGIALMPKQDAALPVTAPTASVDQDLPLAKSDRLPIAAIEQAPSRYFAGTSAGLPRMPEETNSTEASLPGTSFAAANAASADVPTQTTSTRAANTKTSNGRPWRNAYAEKRHRHQSAPKRTSRQSHARTRKPRKH